MAPIETLIPFRAKFLNMEVSTLHPVHFLELMVRLRTTMHDPNAEPVKDVNFEEVLDAFNVEKHKEHFEKRMGKRNRDETLKSIALMYAVHPPFSPEEEIIEKEVADEHQILLQEIHDVLGPSSKLQGILVKMANFIFKKHGTRFKKD